MSVLCGVNCQMLCSIGYCVVQVLLEVSSVVLSAKCCVQCHYSAKYQVLCSVKCCVNCQVLCSIKCCVNCQVLYFNCQVLCSVSVLASAPFLCCG